MIVSNEEGLKKKIPKFGKYIANRSLELNTEKQKILKCREAEGRTKKMSFIREEEIIGKVK